MERQQLSLKKQQYVPSVGDIWGKSIIESELSQIIVRKSAKTENPVPRLSPENNRLIPCPSSLPFYSYRAFRKWLTKVSITEADVRHRRSEGNRPLHLGQQI